MSGASRSLRIVFALAAFAGLLRPAVAEEFGNVFGTAEAEQASKNASAQALSGLSSVFRGYSQREREGFEAGSEAIASGVRMLEDAAAAMDVVPLLPTPVQPTAETGPLIGSAIALLERHGIAAEPTVESLYAGLAGYTRIVSATVSERALGDRGPSFPQLSSLLADYVALGGWVTRIARASSPPR